MKRVNLNRNWTMQPVGKPEVFPAVVPGSVYNDLLLNGAMEDPYWRDNEMKALKLMDEDYVYRCRFDMPEEIRGEKHQILRFLGLDTLADIVLNGEKLAAVQNMHRTYEFDVTGKLADQGNELVITFHSPTKWIAAAYKKAPIEGSAEAMRGFAYLRKAHCMFGWDWGPRLPDAGIFRPIELLGADEARWDSVYVQQHHAEGKVRLALRMDVERFDDELIRRFGRDDKKLEDLTIQGVLTDPDGRERSLTQAELIEGFDVEDPQLWWPNGYGEQPLYTLRVDLLKDGALQDRFEKRIGLRTMEMHREKDGHGEQFCHMVNGVKIFAMGADYIPEDNILARVTPERTYDLLLQAKQANYNCIRVWGGGHYPYDAFWDACDELGLVVWEDFMFACAVYTLSPEFEAEIRAEFKDNIRRIRHHASLGLWCGNNEMEMFVKSRTWVDYDWQVSDYVKMYEYILPQVLKEEDPDTFYWPASPSSGGAFDAPNDERRGDVHYWDVWHGNKPFTEYRKFLFRYVSEFGFQSFPSVKTCETFTLPEDRNIFSYVMEKHQRNNAANGKIMNYMEQTFLYPTRFDTMIYASQLLQAEAIRYGIEHFRRHRGICMGTVVWQLNDCWPVASWASIDYCGRWKALHYAEKRAFAPLMISCEEEGLITQDPNVNAEPYEVKKSIRLNVANESRRDAEVTVRYSLNDASGQRIRGGKRVLGVPALSSVYLDKEDLSEADLYSNYVSYCCEKDGEVISRGTAIFCPPKFFRFKDPHLAVRVEGDELVVSADAYARSVEILNENEDLVLSDNYFDMDPGERRVKILRGAPTGLKLRSVYDIH